jgi:hypothetical protein
VKHDSGKFSRFDLSTFPQVADIIILAKSAKEIAGAEEDGSRAVRAHQRRFLPVVSSEARDGRLAPRLADALLTLQAVHPAVPRSEPALPEALDGLAGALLQHAFAIEFQV